MGPGGLWAAALLLLGAVLAGGSGGPPRYSSRIVRTAGGAVRGVIKEVAPRLEPVEAFLGVPYGGRPTRLGAPPPVEAWAGTRLADTRGPVCPQAPPVSNNRTAALLHMPLGVLLEMEAAAPLLVEQSEDCLSLDLYVPGSGARGVEAPYAVVVWTGGASHEWGGAPLHDGAALAARGRLLVVTPNTRLGLLGYLTTGRRGDPVSQAGGAAVLDLLAALRWLRVHAAAFGGDPRRVTLAAHRAGVATAAALLVLPTARGLVHRVLLLSGSPLAPAALAPDAAAQRDHVARALGCEHTKTDDDSEEHWLATCIRSRPLSVLTHVTPPRARFLSGWAPSPPALPRALHASDAFLQCALAIVVCTTESYHYFGEDEIRHGFEEEHRNRVLRTFVRNVFRWHRNEILAAVRNEYTDWERPIQHPINIRDATLEALSDGALAAPAVRLARLHARRGAPTYLAHFAHAPRAAPQPPRLGSVRGDAEPFFLGLPLLGGANQSRGDTAVAETAVALLAAFAKTGTPSPSGGVTWPRYELSSQQYLAMSPKPRARSHYRGHRLALWLALLPQLHRPNAAPPQHHRLQHDDPDMFSGELFPEPAPTEVDEEVEGESSGDGDAEERVEDTSGEECSPPTPAAQPAQPRPEEDTGGISSYGAALGATVGAGCALLALNAAVLAALYTRGNRLKRGRGRGSRRQRGEMAHTDAPCLPEPEQGTPEPRRSTLKRSSESPRAAPKPPAKRVQIQEISV